jgi:hypothetical protein
MGLLGVERNGLGRQWYVDVIIERRVEAFLRHHSLVSNECDKQFVFLTFLSYNGTIKSNRLPAASHLIILNPSPTATFNDIARMSDHFSKGGSFEAVPQKAQAQDLPG